MTKRFGMVLAVLVALSLVLTACSTESRDTAEDYMQAVLTGEVDAAQDMACDDDVRALTAEVADVYANYFPGLTLEEDDIDLKYDLGKGNNTNEIIVTGSLTYTDAADEDNVRELEFTEERNTRVVLMMDEGDDDWCVTIESEFGERIEGRIPGAAGADESTDDDSADGAESGEGDDAGDDASDADSAEDAEDTASDDASDDAGDDGADNDDSGDGE